MLMEYLHLKEYNLTEESARWISGLELLHATVRELTRMALPPEADVGGNWARMSANADLDSTSVQYHPYPLIYKGFRDFRRKIGQSSQHNWRVSH